jgi:zinc transport system substrate-binding protein
MASLAAEAESIELLELEATIKLECREGAVFGDDDHDEHGHDDHDHEDHEKHEEHGHDDHDHEKHADHDDHDHGHEEHAKHDEHDDHDAHDHDDHKHAEHDDHGHDKHEEEHGHDDDHGHEKHEEHAGHDDHGDDHHGHSHEGTDPHAWLDPQNGKIWLQAIAEELSHHDPENADTYAANAAEGVANIDALIAEMSADLAPAHDLRFVVFHDAYQYFENRFDLKAAGAISLGDASDPSAARVAEVRTAVQDAGVTCVFAEPQFNPGLVGAVAQGGLKVAEIDPLGVGVEMGPNHYAQTLRALSNSILGCLK